MKNRKRLAITTLSCIAIGCTSAAFAASSVPALDEHEAQRPMQRDFMQELSRNLLNDRHEDFRFQHFADLFTSEESILPGGIAPNVAAAVFSDVEEATATGLPGGGIGGPVFGPSVRGGALEMRTGMSTNLAATSTAAPGGGGGARAGGGGGGGEGGSNDQLPEGGLAPIIVMTPQPSAPNNDAMCCCCPDINLAVKDDLDPGVGAIDADGGSGDGGRPAAIPVPAAFWMGLAGLGALGLIRRQRLFC